MDTSKTMQFSILGGAIVLIAPLLLSPAFAQDESYDGSRIRTVNCAIGGAGVQRAVDTVRQGGKATIFIQGQCEEDVLIEIDDVTLSGNKDGDGTIDGGITGTVTVIGARRITIEYLHITGPNQGIQALDGATVNILHNKIVDNVGDGIAAFNNVLVRVNFNTITGNGRKEDFEAGIDAGNNTTVRSNNNYIADNGYAAVEVGNAVHWRSDGGDVIVQKGCNRGDPAGSCGEEDTIAVDCFRVGSCHVRDAEITGFSFFSGMSFFDVRRTTINGNVGAFGGSGVRFRENVIGPDFVDCFSFAFAFGTVSCFVPDPDPGA